MFRKDRMGRRGGGVLLYIKENISEYEVQLSGEADYNEAIWCKLVSGHTTVTIGVVIIIIQLYFRPQWVHRKDNTNIQG